MVLVIEVWKRNENIEQDLLECLSAAGHKIQNVSLLLPVKFSLRVLDGSLGTLHVLFTL